MGIRWYISYPLSYRHVEELMEERGIDLDHATVNRWVVKYSPALESKFRKHKKPVGKSWRMDDTYIKVKGEWVYYYRAVDKEGQTIDFFLSRTRDTQRTAPGRCPLGPALRADGSLRHQPDGDERNAADSARSRVGHPVD